MSISCDIPSGIFEMISFSIIHKFQIKSRLQTVTFLVFSKTDETCCCEIRLYNTFDYACEFVMIQISKFHMTFHMTFPEGFIWDDKILFSYINIQIKSRLVMHYKLNKKLCLWLCDGSNNFSFTLVMHYRKWETGSCWHQSV